MAEGKKQASDTVLMALACGATVANAAVRAGVSERTVYRRLADPDFQKQLDLLRGEMVQRTAATLTAASMEAVKTLIDLQSPATPAAVRLHAARAILELAMRLREAAEVERRLAALEERLPKAT